MGSKALIAGLFVVSLIGVGITAGTVTPVAYGAGELTPGVGITGIIGTLTALISGAGGLWTLFKSGTFADFAKSALQNIQQGDAHGVGVDAAFVTITTAIMLKKKAVSPELMSKLVAVRNEVQSELDAK